MTETDHAECGNRPAKTLSQFCERLERRVADLEQQVGELSRVRVNDGQNKRGTDAQREATDLLARAVVEEKAWNVMVALNLSLCDDRDRLSEDNRRLRELCDEY